MGERVDDPVFERVLSRIEELAAISDEDGAITRGFLSPSMRRTNDLAASWLEAAGAAVSEDTAGNLRGLFRTGDDPGRKRLVIGSHLDTVRNGGKYDGMLGFLYGVATIEQIRSWDVELPFDIEVLGFSDEEGLRFQTAYLGSAFYVGQFRRSWLRLLDADGKSIDEAVREWGSDPDRILERGTPPENVIGYLEAHIEQGPVLLNENVPCGVVTAIAGQTRISSVWRGTAGHAGTTPMPLRHDALCGAAELISLVERAGKQIPSLRATVGQVEVGPNASNVIPEFVRLSVDIRHPDDETRQSAIDFIHAHAIRVANERKLRMTWDYLQQSDAVRCSEVFTDAVCCSVQRFQSKVPRIVSGAGHDAVMMAHICPVAMLFVRCRDGLSHHPEEYVAPEDIGVSLSAYVDAVIEIGTRVREGHSMTPAPAGS